MCVFKGLDFDVHLKILFMTPNRMQKNGDSPRCLVGEMLLPTPDVYFWGWGRPVQGAEAEAPGWLVSF